MNPAVRRGYEEAAAKYASFPGEPGSPEWLAAADKDLQERDSRFQELADRAIEQARETAMPTPTWRDLEEALTTLGSEDNIASRLELLREMRGLSQEQLAKKLKDLGVQMPQSSISKIEAPMRDRAAGNPAKTKRRDITVDEALALAKALDVPVSFLLLPAEAMDNLQLRQILASGGELWQKRYTAELDYDHAVNRLVQAALDDRSWRTRIEAEARRVQVVVTGRDNEGRLRFDMPLPDPVALIDLTRQQSFLKDVLQRLDEQGAEQ